MPLKADAFRLFLETWTGAELDGNDVRVLPRDEWARRRDRLAELAPEFVVTAGQSLASNHDVIRAERTAVPVQVDGRLDEWNHTPELFAYRDRRKSDQFSARLKGLWDDEALYLSIDWRDSTPLVNNVDAATRPLEGWQADCLQARFRIAGKEYHLTAWYSSKSDQSVGVIHQGAIGNVENTAIFLGSGLSHEDPSGFQQSFAKSDDAKGYVQELRIPWKLLDEAKSRHNGTRFRFTAEFFWGNDEADKWPGEMWSTPHNPRSSLRTDLYRNPDAWGDMELIRRDQVESRFDEQADFLQKLEAAQADPAALLALASSLGDKCNRTWGTDPDDPYRNVLNELVPKMVAELERLQQANPQREDIALMHWRLLHKFGQIAYYDAKMSEAAPVLQQAGDVLKSMLERGGTPATLAPSMFRSYELAANSLAHTENDPESLLSAEKLLVMIQERSREYFPDREVSPDIDSVLAVVHLRRGDLPAADAAFHKVVAQRGSLAPQDLFWRAALDERLGDAEKARRGWEAAEKWLADHPKEEPKVNALFQRLARNSARPVRGVP